MKKKSTKHNDLEDMVFQLELNYSEIQYMLDMEHFVASSAGYTFPPGFYQNEEYKLMINSSFSYELKVNITIGDISLISNLTTNRTIKLIKKTFCRAN